MSSNKSFVELVASKIKKAGVVSFRSMFGEYGLYCDKKLVALICDNKLFIKPTPGGKAFIKDTVEEPPYPGAKPYFLVSEKISDPAWLTRLLKITTAELPLPKVKKINLKRKGQ